LVLLGVSFTFLFEFGVSLLNTLGRARQLRSLPVLLLGLWVFVTFFVLTTLDFDSVTVFRTANALARYFIAFPGGLLAAYGLREHAIKRIAPLGVPAIYNTLRVAGIALALYAFFGGLIPPPVSFPPGNFLNARTFEQWTGLPPTVIRSLIGMVMAVTIIRALEVFEVETQRRIEALEQQSIISAERERLARDLHDGALQKVYTAGLLVESASKLARGRKELSARLHRAQVVLDDSITDLRRSLTDLNPSSAQEPEALAAELNRLAADSHYATMVKIAVQLKIPAGTWLTSVRMTQLKAILNEALANTVRHAQARNVRILAEDVGHLLKIAIQDDGVGTSGDIPSGYGLRNMRDRARILNGSLDLRSTRGKGTTVTLEIPWSD
jgi:signal transduction histidine kinase